MADRQHEEKETHENQHSRSEMKEANTDVFESGVPNKFIGADPVEPVTPDPDAVQAPGGDSRPDLIDPATASFTRIDDSQMMTTTRGDLPEAHRELAAEYEQRRSDDNLEIIGQPRGPNDEEIAVLREKKMFENRQSDDR
jgi:hypothetical protein